MTLTNFRGCLLHNVRLWEISEWSKAMPSNPCSLWEAKVLALRVLFLSLSLRVHSSISFDKNTSRNQIIYHPTYLPSFADKREGSLASGICHWREKDRRRTKRKERGRDGEGRGERERFFSIEKSAFREDLQRAGRIAFYGREKGRIISALSNGRRNNNE